MEADACLAAMVMISEALLLVRVNQLNDERPSLTVKAAPRDRQTKTLSFREWTLRHCNEAAGRTGCLAQRTRAIGGSLAVERTVVGHGLLANEDYAISTGSLEGVNNKMKTRKRQAYGFRDQQCFNPKICTIHKFKYALVGRTRNPLLHPPEPGDCRCVLKLV